MTKKELVRIIREVVKREVKSQLTEVTQSKGKVIKENNNQRISLEEALQQTAESDDYRTVKEFTASDARAGFASMQSGYEAKPQTDINGKPVNLEKLGGGLDKALTSLN